MREIGGKEAKEGDGEGGREGEGRSECVCEIGSQSRREGGREGRAGIPATLGPDVQHAALETAD